MIVDIVLGRFGPPRRAGMRLELADVAIQFGGAVKSHAIGDVDHRLRRPNRIEAASAQLQLQGRGLQRALNLNSGGP